MFGSNGELVAQAAHIPGHRGSMAFVMGDLVRQWDWQPGDMVVLNDPFLGGTHLPDVTLIAPVFEAGGSKRGVTALIGFVANRAHHANIGCDTPVSMPVSSTLSDAGVIIAPTLLLRGEQLQLTEIPLADLQGEQLSGDFAAQAGANRVGVRRLQALVANMSVANYQAGILELNA